MEALECNVTSPIALFPFPDADKGRTLCDVTDDGRLTLDGLGLNELA